MNGAAIRVAESVTLRVDPAGWTSMLAGGPVLTGSPGTKADLLRLVG